MEVVAPGRQGRGEALEAKGEPAAQWGCAWT